MISTLQQKK